MAFVKSRTKIESPYQKSRFFDPRNLNKLGLEANPIQAKFAELVDLAFRLEQIRPIEARTGSGKTLGYLVPSLAHACAGERILILTPTKRLQKQIIKDAPNARKLAILGGAANADKIKIAVIQGAENLVCPVAAREEISDPKVLDLLLNEEINALDDPLLFAIAEQVLVDPECPLIRKGCEECPWPALKAEAKEADIVITNHVMALNLCRRRKNDDGAGPIGEFHAAVVDEGDRLSRAASVAWGAKLYIDGLIRFVRQISRRAAQRGLSPQSIVHEMESLVNVSKNIIRENGEFSGSFRERPDAQWRQDVLPLEFRDALTGMVGILKELNPRLNRKVAVQAILHARCARRIRELEYFINGHYKREQTFFMARGREGKSRLYLQEQPHNVDRLLLNWFWPHFRAGVITSAILPKKLKKSPFPGPNAASYHDPVVLPQHIGECVDRALADKNAPPYTYPKTKSKTKNEDAETAYRKWLDYVIQVIAGTIASRDGGILVLTLSWRDASLIARGLEGMLPPGRVLLEAEQDNHSLVLNEFKSTRGKGVLVTTIAAGGQGHDFSEKELRHVVFAKIPFSKQIDLMETEHRIAQGIGRLPSTRLGNDSAEIGTWWLLDSRVWTRSNYWKTCVSSMEDNNRYPSRKRFVVNHDGSILEEEEV